MGCVFRWTVVATALVLLPACSTTDFAKPIGDFATATNDASTAFSGYADTLEKLKQQKNLSDVADTPSLLQPVGCDLTARPSRCELQIAGQPLKPKFLVHTRQIMAAIVTYSKNLQAIATADDVAKLKTASDAIPADVNGLAKAVDAFSKQVGRSTNLAGQVAAISSPAGEIITIALTKIAEYEKLQALRGATERMNTIFADSMALMSFVAVSNQGIANRALSRNFETAKEAYAAAVGPVVAKLKEKPKPGASPEEQLAFKKQIEPLQNNLRAALEKYEAAAEAFNAGLTAKPEAVFTKLADLHANLVDALEMPNPDFQTVFKKLQDFAATAATLATDVKKIDDALHPKT